MPAGQYIIEVKGAEEVQRALSKMAESVEPIIRGEMEKGGRQVEAKMKANAPQRTGELRSSIDYEVTGGGLATQVEISPNPSAFRHGQAAVRGIEWGRLPGGRMPPIMDIKARYGLTLAEAYMVAKRIQEKGTLPGLRIVEKTVDFAERTAQAVGETILSRIARIF